MKMKNHMRHKIEVNLQPTIQVTVKNNSFFINTQKFQPKINHKFDNFYLVQ